jgi:hypothetical protein
VRPPLTWKAGYSAKGWDLSGGKYASVYFYSPADAPLTDLQMAQMKDSLPIRLEKNR